jgi:hypothetical protein
MKSSKNELVKSLEKACYSFMNEINCYNKLLDSVLGDPDGQRRLSIDGLDENCCQSLKEQRKTLIEKYEMFKVNNKVVYDLFVPLVKKA